MAVVKLYLPAEFATFEIEHPIERRDMHTGIVWYASPAGMARCADSGARRLNRAGGPDGVVVVTAANEQEATAELERLRSA